MKEFNKRDVKIHEHYGWNPKAPVLIYENDGKKMRGVITGLNEGDVVHSRASYYLVVKITGRYTPMGHFIVDITGAGFEALVEPCIVKSDDL